MALYNVLIWFKGQSGNVLNFLHMSMALVSVVYLCMVVYDAIDHTNKFSNGYVFRIYLSIYASFTLIVSIVTFLVASIRIRFGANGDPERENDIYLEIDGCCRKYTMSPDGNIERAVKEEAARNVQDELKEIQID